ncbi:hypothetical protein HanRHA438_Chr15g0717461 [Helianthus annuus]|nr:hypothetical protein HanIR_Chr15g0767031 [Helianthus annuus]KAJ0473978.1 hypothetical protein HanHA89_Chr15g0624501 [Helianthus annuus]KAJ0845777.1 hypothetical protein HanRHA438_Chr15g0717461 [Helianthus annuus]
MVGGGWSAVLVLEAVSLMWRSEQKRGRVSLMWTWSAYVDATAVSGGCRRRTGVGGRYPCDDGFCWCFFECFESRCF